MNKRAFTLLELLAVIGIIAVLAGVILPLAGRAIKKAHKSQDSSNLRQIALAYSGYGKGIYKAQNAYEFAETLARSGDLSDGRMWFSAVDLEVEKIGQELPKTIIDGNGNTIQTFRSLPISYEVVRGLSKMASSSTTPIAWTRGLTPQGTWGSFESQRPGVYGSEGGFIAFLDGHVEWFEDLSEGGGKLLNYITKKPTANIFEAISPGASVLDYRGQVRYHRGD